MHDFVIAVRSYQRAEMFRDMTYAMLSKQEGINLKECLYIFVADGEEHDRYTQVLGDLPYKKIVIGRKGGKEIIDFISDYFPYLQPIVFMDDDLEEFFEFTDTPSKSTFNKSSTQLLRYIEDGFKTLEVTQSAFSFSFYSNEFYLQGKPWKEFRPAELAGGFFGCLNKPSNIKTDTAHLDDISRSCRLITKYGGVLIYQWGGFKTATGKNPGGLQSSGDRGLDPETRTEHLRWKAEQVYKNNPEVNKFCKPPQHQSYSGLTVLKLKPITSIKKIHPFEHFKWSQYFQDKPDTTDTGFASLF